MKITSKGRYGLRAMVDLAVNSETEPVSIHSIGSVRIFRTATWSS